MNCHIMSTLKTNKSLNNPQNPQKPSKPSILILVARISIYIFSVNPLNIKIINLNSANTFAVQL